MFGPYVLVGEEPANKAHAGDATAVSIFPCGRKVGSFAERQQLAEGAPLMRMPFVRLEAAPVAEPSAPLDLTVTNQRRKGWCP